MDLAGEAVGRHPFHHGIGIQKGTVDALRRRTQNPVKADGIG